MGTLDGKLTRRRGDNAGAYLGSKPDLFLQYGGPVFSALQGWKMASRGNLV